MTKKLSNLEDVIEKLAEFNDDMRKKGIYDSESVATRVKLAGRKDMSAKQMLALAKDIEVTVLKELAKNPTLTDEIFDHLTEDHQPEPIKLAVAHNKSCPVFILKKLSIGTTHRIKIAVIQNSHVTQEILTILSKDANNEVKAAVAESEKTSEEVFKEFLLLSDKIRTKLARNHKVSSYPEIFLKLAFDENEDVRSEIASSIAIADEKYRSYQLVEKFIHDISPKVRFAISDNPMIRGFELVKLMKDTNPDVIQNICMNIKTPPEKLLELLSDGDENNYIAIAMNTSTPIEGLRDLCSPKYDLDIRCHVASNPSSDESVMIILSSDPEPIVRREIALRDDLTQSVISLLVLDASFIVIKALLMNKLMSRFPESLSELYEYQNDPEILILLAQISFLPPDTLLNLSTHSDPMVVAACAQNPEACSYLLNSISKHSNLLVRKSVASHKNTSEDVLEYYKKNYKGNGLREIVETNLKERKRQVLQK